MQTKPGGQFRGTSLPFWVVLVIIIVMATLGTARSLDATTGKLEQISHTFDGSNPDGTSGAPALSADGRFVAFHSQASNLIPDDTNGRMDIFVYDRQAETMTRVSRAFDGSQSNGDSDSPSLSADGQVVAFTSLAFNLVSEDTNGLHDVFVYDRQTDTTTQVSRAFDGAQSNGPSDSATLSADGRFVAFASLASNLVRGDTNGRRDVFIHDRLMGLTTRVSLGPNGIESNGESFAPALSADGRFVAFVSMASNLVPNDTNGQDVFVHDRSMGTTTRVSLGPHGRQSNGGSFAPSISADGRFIAFASVASNLVPDDTNNTADVFVHERRPGITTLISVSLTGTTGNRASVSPSISPDGRFVAFASLATDLVSNDVFRQDIFVHDRRRDVTALVPQMYGRRSQPSLGPNGHVVAFTHGRSFSVDVFVYDPFFCDGLAATIAGTPDDDFLIGTDGDDVIVGFAGDDTIYGGEGNDVSCGGPGSDRLGGEGGNDRLFGEESHDILRGGPGADRLGGGPGRNILLGEAGPDRLISGSGDDFLDGGDDDDSLNGGAGDDSLYGGNGDDKLIGGDGNDYLRAGDGKDGLSGGARDFDICDGGNDTAIDTKKSCEIVLGIP